MQKNNWVSVKSRAVTVLFYIIHNMAYILICSKYILIHAVTIANSDPNTP